MGLKTTIKAPSPDATAHRVVRQDTGVSSGGLLKVATLGPSGDIVLHFELIIASMPIERIEVNFFAF